MKEMEKALKALANRRRLAILKYLRHAEKATVGDIAREIRLSFKATSKHLSVLASADLVEHEQVSRQIFYFLVQPIHPLIKTIFNS
jgi:DNA-binding transcriptional ArsR family regulator